MAEVFYETLALAAFALLGLWWVVVADRRREWSVLPYRRRQAYSVSLYFTLTGIMSLVSLISEDHPALWRSAFGIAGAIVVGLAGLFVGLVESLSGLFVSPQWSSLVVFSVLFIYLVLHPVDFRALRASILPAASSPRG